MSRWCRAWRSERDRRGDTDRDEIAALSGGARGAQGRCKGNEFRVLLSRTRRRPPRCLRKSSLLRIVTRSTRRRPDLSRSHEFQPGRQNLSFLHPASRPASASFFLPVSRLRQAEGRKCRALLHSVAAAGGAARCRRRKVVLTKAAAVAAGTNGGKMRVISQSELLRLTRTELSVLLRKIACELPDLAERSVRAAQRAREPAEYRQRRNSPAGRAFVPRTSGKGSPGVV